MRAALPGLSCLLIAVPLVWVSGCARQQPPPPPAAAFKAVATAKELMHAIVIPASDAVWKVPNEAPAGDEAWLAVENSALALAESGNLLMMAGRAVDQGEWMKESRALIDTATAAVQAARAKDVDKMSEAGNAIYDVCAACHEHYMKQE